MDTALIVIGLLLVGMLIVWIFAYLSDPKQIDEQMEAEVREESPEEIERSAIRDEARKAESNAEDIAFYSPGDTTED
jgi:hypothetical protein